MLHLLSGEPYTTKFYDSTIIHFKNLLEVGKFISGALLADVKGLSSKI